MQLTEHAYAFSFVSSTPIFSKDSNKFGNLEQTLYENLRSYDTVVIIASMTANQV